MILYSRLELARYKRRALKRYPNEYLEIMFGTLLGSQINIEKFVQVPQAGNKFYVNWLDEEGAQDLIAETESTTGLDFIGSIHSHTLTHCEAHLPSALDNDQAYVWEERVFALDHIRRLNKRFRHAVSFYKTQQPLEDVAAF